MRPAAAPPVCRCCGSAAVRSRGSKRGTFIIQDFAYLSCTTCGYLFVDPFAGYEIYNDDYYRGRGPDPYVDYASEYADYRTTDRILEFDDLARLASDYFSATPTRIRRSDGSTSVAVPAACSSFSPPAKLSPCPAAPDPSKSRDTMLAPTPISCAPATVSAS